eukprot:365324-Chlamydomonas_euryale.AAC.1
MPLSTPQLLTTLDAPAPRRSQRPSLAHSLRPSLAPLSTSKPRPLSTSQPRAALNVPASRRSQCPSLAHSLRPSLASLSTPVSRVSRYNECEVGGGDVTPPHKAARTHVAICRQLLENWQLLVAAAASGGSR